MSNPLNLKAAIEQSYANLRPSERLVADHLTKMTGMRLNHSITELARLIGVSEATVSRASRAFGLKGFADLKLTMASSSQAGESFPNIPANLSWSDATALVAKKLAPVLANSMMETERLLDGPRLERAVDAIVAARRVVLMGVGGAAAICQEAAHVLLKIGIDASSHDDGYTQTIVAATLKPDCLLIVISHTGTTPTVVNATLAARRNGAQTIGITGNDKSALARAADLVFVTGNSVDPSIPLHGDFLEGRISQLYLIDVLYIGVMFRLGDAAKSNLAVTTQALADHYGAADPLASDDMASAPRERRPRMVKPSGSRQTSRSEKSARLTAPDSNG